MQFVPMLVEGMLKMRGKRGPGVRQQDFRIIKKTKHFDHSAKGMGATSFLPHSDCHLYWSIKTKVNDIHSILAFFFKVIAIYKVCR